MLLSIQQKLLESDWEKESTDFSSGNNVSIEDATKINNITKLYKLLAGSTNTLLQFISSFAQAKGNDVLVKSLQWNYSEPTEEQRVKNKDHPGTINVTLNVIFDSSNLGLQALFDNFDMFIERLENQFKDYKVDYSRLPSKITFGESTGQIPIKISITGPIDAKS